MNSQNVKKANLIILNNVAEKLDDLCEDLVFLGGSVLGILITDPIAPDVRITIDVDCIVNVGSNSEYIKLEKNLREKGFTQDIHEKVICRWFFNEIVLDVMPTDKKILGFGNKWYNEAIKHFQVVQLETSKKIKVVKAPYFLAMKFEAFNDRGNSDYFGSHDLEDIISIVDGRETIVNEIELENEDIQNYLISKFSALLKSRAFLDALPGHLNYGAISELRLNIVLERMRSICHIKKESKE